MREHYCFGRQEQGELSRERVEALIAEGRERLGTLARVPIEDVLLLLERVGRAWADPSFGPRRAALESLPGKIGFSREMVELELSGLTMALSRPYLEGKLRAELGRIDALDLFHRKPGSEGFQKAVPRGLVLHVASGNVSTTGVLSLLEGLLTRNVNVLKVASNAPDLPLAFARTLAELDHTGVLASSFAVLGWSGEATPHHELFCREADAIVVWGGEEVVATYRGALGPRTRLIAYGPKVSCALLGAEALAEGALAATAASLARDISLWDQNACSSPQVLYVEDADPACAATQRLVAALAPALDAAAETLPMGELSLQERAEITKERELALSDELMGLAELHTPAGQNWTIVVEHDPAFRLSPLYRTILIKPVASLDATLPLLAPWRDYLQTVALGVAPARVGALADALLAVGAHRLVRLGEMSGGFPGEPHDGQYGLGELVRWAGLDAPGCRAAYDGTGLLSAEQEAAIALAKRRRLVESHWALGPFYRERLGTVRLRDEADWHALPLTSKADMLAHTPPTGLGLVTSLEAGGHWLRSGGSSGDPKLSIYSYDDYEADMWRAARGAHAAGLRAGEKVANVFFAGDMYGSFLSLNRVLELVGCHSFPFTNHAPIESVLAAMRQLGIETIMGLSSWVQAVLHEAMRQPEGLRVRRVYYAGEPFDERERRTLETVLGVERVASIGYGAVDAGPMGFQCEHAEGGVHHVHADHVHLEVVDPATGRPVPPGEPGEVVVTNLNRRVMPLIRYRIGDLARMLPGDCPCGRPSPRFELLGRAEELLRLGAVTIPYQAIQAVVAEFAPLTANPQVVLDAPDVLAVRAELVAEGAPPDLAAALRAELVSRVPAVSALRLGVEIVAPGGLERVGRSGKVVRVIDRREQP